MRVPRRSALLQAVLFSALASSASAQTFKATLTGVVTDPTGAVLPGVSVTATHQERNTRASAVTDDHGGFTILELTPGPYRLEAELAGFKRWVQRDIVLEVEAVARIDVRMQLGELSENVQVTAETPLIHTESGARGQVITEEEITELPMEGRDFADLAYLTVGVVPRAQGGQGSFGSINGARADGVNFVVDSGINQNPRGGAAQVRPSIDAIQEFRVQTSNYSAEYGRLSSGIINMALRSGTNAFHGSVYEYHRNSVLDARNFFDREKSLLNRHNYGGTLGGPIRRDRAFFFFSYQGMRLRQGIPRLGRVPTLKQRAGDFSEGPAALIDPVTRAPYPNNVIPGSQFHPVSVKLLEFYPLPNNAGPNNFYVNKLDHDQYHDWIGKVDHHLKGRHTVSVRYLLNNRFLIAPFAGSILPGFGNEADQRQHMWGLNYTHVLRPKLLNQTLVALTRTSYFEHAANWKTDWGKRLGIEGITSDPKLFGFPRVTVRGYAALGDDTTMPLDYTVTNYQLNNITSWIKGRHSIKGGVETVRTQFFQLFANDARGIFNFLGRVSTLSTDANRQEPFADFLLGFPQNTNRRVTPIKSYVFSTSWGLYLQDDWKVRRNLTVNLGLRYELLVPPYEKFGRWANFVPELGRVVLSGERDFPRSLVRTDRNNLAPRIGIAWRPRNRSRTVVRAGWGAFYGTNILNPLRNQLGTNPPFSVRENFSRLASNPLLLTFSNPFPDRRTVIDSVNAPNGFQYDAPTGQLFQYNLTIEQQLTANVAVDLAYVGSKGTHLGRQYDANQPLRGPDVPAPFPRPHPGFAAIDYFAFEADSNYNALQVSLRKRSSRGLNYRVNYSFSKSIDDASQISTRSAAGFAGAQDVRNRAAERALSDFDRPHAFVASAIYRLPFGRTGSAMPGWLRGAVGGWQASTIVRLLSGTPISPQLSSFDFNLGEAKRPDRIGSGALSDPTPNLWFNVRDFPPVPTGGFRFGNSGRNVVRGPAFHYFDVSFMKQYRMGREKQRLELRWEIYNVPNFTNFNLPEEQVDLPTAGRISAAGAPRRMQVAVRYTF